MTLRRRRTATQEAGRVLSSRDMFKILFPPKAKFDAQVGREWRELDPAPLLEAYERRQPVALAALPSYFEVDE